MRIEIAGLFTGIFLGLVVAWLLWNLAIGMGGL